MRVQIIRPEELRLTANGPGVPGQEGVIYQTPRNGSTMSRTYIWNGERHVQFGQPEVEALVSRAGITADDTGTAWLGAPALLSFSAVLASGTATTVLLEVRDSAGTVATAATIVADTVGQTLRQSLLMRQQSEYRFRRSSGTGSVTVTV